MTATKASVPRLYVGTSGWSYPSWRPAFYPAGAKPGEFLGHYAERLPSVELNSTGYRIPAEEQFRRWADLTPAGFRFAVKMQAYQLRQAATFEERVRQLGERLGPIRLLVTQARDEGFLTLALGSLDPELRIAFDFRHDSWEGVELPENAVLVNEREARRRFVTCAFATRRTRMRISRDSPRKSVRCWPRARGLRVLQARGRAERAALRGALTRSAPRRAQTQPTFAVEPDLMCSITSYIPSAPTDSMCGSIASCRFFSISGSIISCISSMSAFEEPESDDLVPVLFVADDEDLTALGHLLGALLRPPSLAPLVVAPRLELSHCLVRSTWPSLPPSWDVFEHLRRVTDLQRQPSEREGSWRN